MTAGFDARGKRITRKASGTTKTGAKAELKDLLRDHDDGVALAPSSYTVTEAVRDRLAYQAPGKVAISGR